MRVSSRPSVELGTIAAPVQILEEWKQIGIGIVGLGGIARAVHLPAYKKHGLRVMGGYDISPSALDQGVSVGLPFAYRSLEELLDDSRVSVVDVATRPEDRAEIVSAALRAGKHVLAQKPLALSMEEARSLVDLAERVDRKLAVNVNGRWAPPWMGATRLVSAGLLGQPFAVTHVYDLSFAWTRGTHFDEMKHFGLYDYSVHWVDIGVRWLRPARPVRVTARDYRLQCQPSDSHTPWGLDIYVVMSDASTMAIRGVGGSPIRRRRHPFMIHGSTGIARGSVLDGDELELESEGVRTSFPLEGDWFPDGFAGSMGELLRVVVEGGEPDNGARDGLSTLAVVLAAVESSENDGVPVDLGPKVEANTGP
jgi:predicted dehydrogenase